MNAVNVKFHQEQLQEVFAWLAIHVPYDDAKCDDYIWSFKPSKPFDIPVQDYMFYFRNASDADLFERRWG